MWSIKSVFQGGRTPTILPSSNFPLNIPTNQQTSGEIIHFPRRNSSFSAIFPSAWWMSNIDFLHSSVAAHSSCGSCGSNFAQVVWQEKEATDRRWRSWRVQFRWLNQPITSRSLKVTLPLLQDSSLNLVFYIYLFIFIYYLVISISGTHVTQFYCLSNDNYYYCCLYYWY